MKLIKNSYNVLGCMSGTSLDGLDLALCRFDLSNNVWDFSIQKVQTIRYSDIWRHKLSEASMLTAEDLIVLDHEYGVFTAELINTFLDTLDSKPDFIVSHGHTVFHKPENGYSLQIGNGNDISSITDIPVIYDLRSKDISMGGQGAPLVPIGDKLLFSKYDACLNLGGFSNISFEKGSERIAFDICPANIILNELASKESLEFDDEGWLGKSGDLIPELLMELNNLEFYRMNGPKSLGKEWLDENFKPVLSRYQFPNRDILRTIYEHISIQVSLILNKESINEVLVTGGGSYNSFLLELLDKHCRCKLVVPEKDIINFKEAIIFAFLGVLRIRGENNSLSSVSGARKDNSGGVLAGF